MVDDVDVDTLLKVLLVLVVVWIALEILEIVLGVMGLLFGPVFAILKPLIGLVVLALIVLWLLDRL